ncbi:HET-domain-containing protein [Hypoxylon sp. NC1633]|nr:HET-domain-containing protein [Hypoxylon sp. NC1633]
MINWHKKRCTRADVVVSGDVPFCANCDEIAQLDPNEIPSPGLQAPSNSSQGVLDLAWPASVVYNTGRIPEHDNCTDLTPQLRQSTDKPDTDQQHYDCRPQASSSDIQIQSNGYDSLHHGDNIRLLRLGKGAWDDPLHGTLNSIPLNSSTGYEAISYTWGDERGDITRSRCLFIGESWLALPITKNCEAALRRLRLPEKDRVLWIDAVCINQTNILERSHQVGLMHRIYSTASTCLVYLGEHRKNSRTAMKFIDWERKSGFMTKQLSVALSSLFKRPYFRRTWILQELVLSKTIVVYCGGTTTRWCKIISTNWDRYPTVYIPSWVKNFELCYYRQALDFPRWIFEMSSTTASDPRDKIFSVLGLFRGLEDDGLVPDYSLSIAQVYTGIAAYLLTKHNMKHIIGLSRNPSAGLPSWVPDWRFIQSSWWKADDQAFEREFIAASTELQQRKLWLLGATLDQPGGDDCANIHDLFALQTNDCGQHNCASTTEIHRQTGGLLISPEYIIPLHSPFTPSNPESRDCLWAWELLSTSPVITHEDYVGCFPGHKFWFLLRKVSRNPVYKITGRCSLAVKYTEQRQLTHVQNVLMKAKQYRLEHKSFDLVHYWVSRKWNQLLWTAYADATRNSAAGVAVRTSQSGSLGSLEAAFADFQLFRLNNTNQYHPQPYVSSSIRLYPQAKQLIDCIRFWSKGVIWKFISDIQASKAFPNWEFLKQKRQQWLSVVENLIDSVQSQTLPLQLPDSQSFINKLRPIPQYAEAYREALEESLFGRGRDLSWILDCENREREREFAHVESLTLHLRNILADSERESEVGRTHAIKITIQSVIIERRCDSQVIGHGALHLMKEFIIDILEAIIPEDYICNSTKDEDKIYQEFLGEIYSGDSPSWSAIIEILGDMSTTENRAKSCTQDALTLVKQSVREVASGLRKGMRKDNAKSDAFMSMMKLITTTDFCTPTSHRTLQATIDGVRMLNSAFDHVYAEARELYEKRMALNTWKLCFSKYDSVKSEVNLKSIIPRVALEIPRYPDATEVARECQFIQSLMDVSMKFEQAGNILIV